jgi:hypothetical protein
LGEKITKYQEFESLKFLLSQIKTMEDFVINLKGEIGLRKQLTHDYLNSGNKMYLLTRNVILLINGLGIFAILHEYRIEYAIAMFAIGMFLICVNDYLNFSGKFLNEMLFLRILEIALEEIEITSTVSTIKNKEEFITRIRERLDNSRVGVYMFSREEITDHGSLISKKDV